MALKKPLAPSRLTVYGVGTIIGDGNHSVIGPAEAKAGAGLSPSFVLAGGHLRGLCRFVLGSWPRRRPARATDHKFVRALFPSP